VWLPHIRVGQLGLQVCRQTARFYFSGRWFPGFVASRGVGAGGHVTRT
jgi:hypothetical protein